MSMRHILLRCIGQRVSTRPRTSAPHLHVESGVNQDIMKRHSLLTDDDALVAFTHATAAASRVDGRVDIDDGERRLRRLHRHWRLWIAGLRLATRHCIALV